MTTSRTTKALTALLFATTFMFLGMATSAQAAAPALDLEMAHAPEQFERLSDNGEYPVGYTVTVNNTGDAPTAGPYVLEDTPPAELTVRSVQAGEGWTCTTAAQVSSGTPLSCTSESVMQPGASSLALSLQMTMSPTAPDSLTNEATISGGGSVASSAADPAPVVDRAAFSVIGFTARSVDSAEADYTVAGGHPFQATLGFHIPQYLAGGTTYPVEDFRNVVAKLPPGFLANPSATPRCPLAKIEAFFFPQCPAGSRVGTAKPETFGGGPMNPIFNVPPERGYPAAFAFKVALATIVLFPIIEPRTGSYSLGVSSVDADRLSVGGVTTTFFGVPSTQNFAGGAEVPFVSNPSNCSDAHPVTQIAMDSWQHPGRKKADGSPDLSDPNWKTAAVDNPPVTGCDDPALASQFHPSIEVQPVQGNGPVQANQPSGLQVDLDFPQTNDPTNPNETFDPSIPQAPELKNATVTLPAGMAISPSAADGLGACSDLASNPEGDQVRYDDTKPVTCPDASKIGTVTAISPLLALRDPVTDAVTGPEPISGDVYLVKPHPGDLPIGEGHEGTYRMLIQIESAERGINVKLPGTVKADKATGQLTATFTENPQLPVKHLELNLRSGPRAPLSTPKTCGAYTTTTDLEPWSAPGTPNAHPSSSFPLDQGCPQSLGQRPFAPALSAGTESSAAGASSPFVMHLTRKDSEQEFSALDVGLPTGFTAKLAGVPYCSDAAIAAAAGRSGAAEQASPSCPAASQIGTLTTGAGPGSNPYYVSGKAYLAGPYKGAPISLAFITPAVAGPFDLGNVVVRAAAFVNPETAQVSVKTDRVPQILDGVPLGIRSIAVKVDRPGFALNPTNCEAKSINLNIAGASGASAAPSNSFQVGDCDKLAFGPKLKIQLKGATKRIGHPALRAVVTAGPGEANISTAQVNLPHGEFLDQGNLNKTCTKPVLLAGACPETSIYGYARAWTPLLDQPLQGPVYLVGGYGYKLPALVAELNGQIKVLLVGRVDSGPNKGIRNTFEMVPDAPVSRFELSMKGGKKYGLLENSENLCKAKKAKRRANVRFGAQNGKVEQFKPLVANQCGKSKAKKKHAKHRA